MINDKLHPYMYGLVHQIFNKKLMKPVKFQIINYASMPIYLFRYIIFNNAYRLFKKRKERGEVIRVIKDDYKSGIIYETQDHIISWVILKSIY